MRPVALRGLLAARRRGDGVRRAARRHDRGRGARGRRPRRRDRPARAARRPRRRSPPASSARSTTPSGSRPASARPAGSRVLDRFTWRATAVGTVEQYRRAARPAAHGNGDTPMLTVDFDRLGVRDGARAARPRLRWRPPRVRGDAARRDGDRARLRRGASSRTCAAVVARRCSTPVSSPTARPAARSTATRSRCRSPTTSFDHVIASEVLEHLWADDARDRASSSRVLRPGGRHGGHGADPMARTRLLGARLIATTTRPAATSASTASTTWRPSSSERACGCVARTTRTRCTRPTGGSSARSVSTTRTPWPVRQYHDFLTWQITEQPRWVNQLERTLNPVLGKSLVVYTQKVDRP